MTTSDLLTPYLRVENVTRRYGNGAETVDALRGVSLGVRPGQFVALVGRSGCGKTTLLNLCGGMDFPSTGTVRIGEVTTTGLSDAALTRLRRTQVGFIFQFFQLLPTLTLLENIILPMEFARLYTADARKARALELLQMVGVADHAHKYPTAVSGGQQQRVAIARALAGKPALLLADEPTGALDTNTGIEILALFDRLNREGATVVLVTHDHDVARATKRTIEMRDGHIVSDQFNDRSARHDANV